MLQYHPHFVHREHARPAYGCHGGLLHLSQNELMCSAYNGYSAYSLPMQWISLHFHSGLVRFK